MKILALCFLAAALAVSCTKTANHADMTTTTSAVTAQDTDPLLPLEENAPRKMKITGMVETADSGEVYIVENWESRSRVSYEVTGELVDEIRALKGKVVTVQGMVTKQSMWSGTIDVVTLDR